MYACEAVTPLASIRGYSELSLRDPALSETTESSLERIQAQSIRMTALVEDLLLLARLDEGQELVYGTVEPAAKGTVRQVVTIQQGIETEKAKEIVKAIKDAKLKVQAAIQGEQVRVTGKKRDDLQAVIALLKGKDFGLPLQFSNYRN